MIDLTVKTLDSQNHSFSVEDDITVSQFKEHIADVVNIPSDSQRLIYCGRVLQDEKKLQEYDVQGKVIHLVQRAPPSCTNRRSRSPSQPSTTQSRRLFQSPIYLGSMALPSGIMEAQGIVPPPPTQSLSGSRLNVAKRMLRRADAILTQLEDPSGTRARESPTEEPSDDVTPVFAAQVYMPNAGSDDALAAAVSAVENGLHEQPVNGAAVAPAAPTVPETNNVSPMSVENAQEEASTSSQTNQPQRERPAGLPENSSSTVEMSRLLDELNKLHDRLRPFMQTYHSFMSDDPSVEGEEHIRKTQSMINRVSEIMHLLGHAYHSLSDVMVQVSQPPPRPLLCRPILIQHSAVLQAGIPIQVEAQINLAPPEHRRPDSSTNQPPTSQPSTETSTTAPVTDGAANTVPTSTPAAPAASDTTATSSPRSSPPFPPSWRPTVTSQQIRPNVHEIRIDSFPIDIRNMVRNVAFEQIAHELRRQQNNNTQAPQQQQVQSQQQQQQQPQQQQQQQQQPVLPQPVLPQPVLPQPVEPPLVPPQPTQNIEGQTPPETTGNQTSRGVYFNNMNPNMEFFMEVTPESITIDSLETTVVTSAAQADNVLRGTFGGAPPDFLQSIIQAVTGQIMGGNIPQPPQPTSEPTESSQESTTTSAPTGTNTQARSSAQTHPTTATQTRSTSRPHVHLAQHTMQGFDPFLPCNSHHIRRRRNQERQENREAEVQNNNQPPNPLYNILQGFLRTVGTHVGRMQRSEQRAEQNIAAQSSAAPNVPSEPLPPFSTLLTGDAGLSQLRRFVTDARNTQGTSIAAIFQNIPEHSYVEGESLFSDLMMTLARGLTFGELVALNNGQLYPLARIRPALRTFFRNRVLHAECPTQPAIERGAARLVDELQPVLEILNTVPVREDIDLVQSVRQLFRSRFPCIISMVMSRMNRSLNCLVEQCLLTIRHLCALILHCSLNGQSDVEAVFRQLISRYTAGISPEILDWTVVSSVSQLRSFMSTLDVPAASVQSYVVRRSDNITTETPAPVVETPQLPTENLETIAEPDMNLMMECEEAPVVEVSVESHPEPVPIPSVVPLTGAANPELELDPLPNVVIGTEAWHDVTPGDWIPIITRDIQRQRRQGTQPPFSDAYLSGMPSKRRKIVQSAKPTGNVSQVISEGVRRAVTATGLSTAAPVETVAQAASNDLGLQSAYRELLRTRVSATLRDNPDFTPDRFPNASSYFNVK